MSKNSLELRSWKMVALAYVLGPFIGLNALWAFTTLPMVSHPDFNPGAAKLGWFLVLMFGGWVCLLVEMAFITPLLIGYKRQRWRWLNGWSGAAVGFLLGAAPWLALKSFPPGPPDYTHVENGVVFARDGQWTLQGWERSFIEAAEFGAVGLIAAIVFRMIAVRSAQDPQNSQSADA